jgi:hypothetical protein
LETEPGPLRDQDTPVLLDPVTVAVNCCVWDLVRLTPKGLSVIEITGGGGWLFTDTEMLAPAWFAATSWTTAERLWVPFEIDLVFQLVTYGLIVTTSPIGTLSTKNWTRAPPKWAITIALTLTVPLTELPSLGNLIAMSSFEAAEDWLLRRRPGVTARATNALTAKKRWIFRMVDNIY